MRTHILKTITDSELFKNQLLNWSQQFREVVFLDSNNHKNQYSDYDFALAVDAFTSIKTDYHNAFEDLKQYQQITQDWLFGYLSYDLKNNLEELKSKNCDGLDFPDLFFFQPKKLFLFKENQLEIQYLNMCDDEIEADFKEITNIFIDFTLFESNNLEIKQRITETDYSKKVSIVLEHIHRGDIYEANFCMEFYAENATINPLAIYQKLNTITQTPFATFFKNNNDYVLCASPERYLRKRENNIISQPIKGTAPRFKDLILDEKSKSDLEFNEKERSENIMISDLVRNDLSKTAEKGSVKVEELCKVYSFLQVHHMITTISSDLKSDFSAIDVLKTTFPMGSMTGAPKISAMQIIENLEETKRGLYSGAIGYFTPTGDFDFNVVIRSILYNKKNKYLSFSVGSAITSRSEIAAEYDECLLKAKAMIQVLK